MLLFLQGFLLAYHDGVNYFTFLITVLLFGLHCLFDCSNRFSLNFFDGLHMIFCARLAFITIIFLHLFLIISLNLIFLGLFNSRFLLCMFTYSFLDFRRIFFQRRTLWTRFFFPKGNSFSFFTQIARRLCSTFSILWSRTWVSIFYFYRHCIILLLLFLCSFFFLLELLFYLFGSLGLWPIKEQFIEFRQ